MRPGQAFFDFARFAFFVVNEFFVTFVFAFCFRLPSALTVPKQDVEILYSPDSIPPVQIPTALTGKKATYDFFFD